MLKGKRSFFTELFISFLLLLCIPIITIVLIMWQSNRIVKEQVQDIENKRLHLYVEQLEEVMENMKDICHTIYSSEYCKLYASEIGKNSLWAYDLSVKVKNTLQSLHNISYYDVFVYYDDNRIVSAQRSSLTAEDYYATYYSGLKVDENLREEFLGMLKSDYKRPMCHIINNDTQNSYLCMTMGVRNSKYTICVVLEPSYLEQLLIMQSGNAKSLFGVYNVENQLLFSNNSGIEASCIEDLVSLEKLDSDIWLDKNDYMMQVRYSAVLDNYYVYAVSKDLFWSTLRWLRIWGYAGMVLCVCISGFFAYRSAVRAYKPVDNIMEILKRKRGNDEQEGKTEFSHIISFVEHQEKALREKQKISKEWFLHGLLEGKKADTSPEEMEKNNIVFSGERFVVCMIYADALLGEMDELRSFTVQNVLEELCDSIGKAYFVGFSKNRYALLINITGEEGNLKQVLSEGQEFLRMKLQIILSIGYSNCHKGISAIPEAYKEAQEAIRYRFLLGSGRIISYEEIKVSSTSYRKDDKSKVYMLMLEYIEHKKEGAETENFVEQLMYIYQMNEEMYVDAALVFKNEIVSAVGEIMLLCGYNEEDCQRLLKQLKNAETLSDFWQKLSGHIAELCKCEVKRKSSVDILEETKHFIDEKYSDTDMSVSSIGNAMGMQGNHLSKLFKERYGITMLDYLTTVRIQQAKKYIREKDMAVQEVAERTGFLSSTVFIRTFKKKEGITPGKYKEMTEKEKN